MESESKAAHEGQKLFSRAALQSWDLYQIHLIPEDIPAVIQIFLVHMDGFDLADEQFVRSGLDTVYNAALDADRAIREDRRVNAFAILPFQIQRGEFMEAAQNMLRFSDYTCAEISAILAFSSQSHFNRVFRAQTGYTPKEFRNRFFRTAQMESAKA